MNDSDERPTVADTKRLYRLPWTLGDNAMTWLEVTRRCNISCDACFIENTPEGDKSVTAIERELKLVLKLRRTDSILIAGGEPLVHPNICDIVTMVRSLKVKPIIVTNGVGLDDNMIRKLKKAGVYGFTFHVDSHQTRPGWNGKSEIELNDLRQSLADMVKSAGGLSCTFNTTVFPDTLRSVPGIVRWALDNYDRVNVMTLICVRTADMEGPFDYFAGGRKVTSISAPYARTRIERNLTANDILAEIREIIPEFSFCAYLGGTILPGSLKWAIGNYLISKGKIHAFFGPSSMEFIQGGSHLTRGRYLSYTNPRAAARGKLSLILGLIDSRMRKGWGQFSKYIARKPSALLRPLYVQGISVVQPVDILPSGEQDNCDGCPNRTLWKNILVPACRLEEFRNYGTRLITVPKSETTFGKADL